MSLPRLVLCLAAGLLAVPLAPAQELRAQATPLTAWLDLRATRVGAQTTPAWVEALEFRGSPKQTDRSVFRIRLSRPAAATDDLQIRLFFDDLPTGYGPEVTAWDELGAEMIRSGPLGQGLGLPSSETLVFPMRQGSYLEIDAAGDGSQVRGVFLTWLTKIETRQAADFPTHEAVRQAFHIPAPQRARKDDAYLFGVVTATLQADAVTLKPGAAPESAFGFDLERQPLVAMVSFEELGLAVDAPPEVVVNGRAAGPAAFTLPDLADPAYQGLARTLDPQMTLRYTGWMHGQKVIPGSLLRGGLNNLGLVLSNGTDPIAVRNVEIQLKYPWEKFDYLLSPPSP